MYLGVDTLLRDVPVARICVRCGSGFFKKPSERRPVKFCTDECRLMFAKENSHRYFGRYARKPRARVEVTKVCTICGDNYVCDKSNAKVQKTCGFECAYKSNSITLKARNAHRLRKCEVCAAEFKPYRMNRFQKKSGLYQRTCSAGCAEQYRLKVGFKPTSVAVNGYSRCASLDKDRVDPIAVCERDDWTCWICGVDTPRELRGTTDDRAPEVDHVYPLSKGGDHSYLNTACACRKCNSTKRDAIPPIYSVHRMFSVRHNQRSVEQSGSSSGS